MSISHEIQSLSDHERYYFSIEDSSKVQENSYNHNIEPSSCSISKELQDSRTKDSINYLGNLISSRISNLVNQFMMIFTIIN